MDEQFFGELYKGNGLCFRPALVLIGRTCCNVTSASGGFKEIAGDSERIFLYAFPYRMPAQEKLIFVFQYHEGSFHAHRSGSLAPHVPVPGREGIASSVRMIPLKLVAFPV